MSKRHRINLTVSDDLFSTLTEIHELTGQPRAAIINELLEEVRPQLNVMLDLNRKLRANKIEMSEAKQFVMNMLIDVNDNLNDVQADLNIKLRKINNDEE